MILTLIPGEKFEVPVDADFSIRFGNPFTEAELAVADLSITYTRNDGAGSWAATPDGEWILLEITPGMLTPGFYALKPVAVVDGLVRKYTKAVGMRVLADNEVV